MIPPGGSAAEPRHCRDWENVIEFGPTTRRPEGCLGKVGMRKGLVSFVMAASLCTPYALGHAQDAAPAKAQPSAPAAQQAAPPKAGGATSPRSDAAEARYRAWVEREHAQDSADFQKEKAKIEDKYKGYVRPKREKKQSAKAGESSDKGN